MGRTLTSVVVPCPVLVGRAGEMARLRDAVDAAPHGHGGVVLVVGEAGIGKSRLVQEVAALARERGMAMLRGRCVPGSESTAFSPLVEAFAAVPTTIVESDDLRPWSPALAGILPTAAQSGAREQVAPPVRGEAVIRLLRAAVAPAAAGLLVLEDLHWADPDTLAVVEHLSDHLGDTPLLCLATARTGEDGPARQTLRRVADRRTALVLEPARLNDAQVAAMVHSCTGGGDPSVLQRATALGEGVPFLVEELLVSPGLPESFADTVRGRLEALSDDDRRVLVTAATAGRFFDWRLLARATDLDDERVVTALEHGVAAQLLAVDGDGFRFRHALTADAVLASVVPPRVREAAAGMLAALDSTGDLTEPQWTAAARLAERAGRPERAGGLHLAVGERALRRGALHSAVASLEIAALLLPDGPARSDAVERLVEALVTAGRYDEAVTRHRDGAGRLTPPAAARTRLLLAAGAATASRWEECAGHLAAARSVVDGDGPPVLRAELALRSAELALGTDDLDEARSSARTALDTAREALSAELECEALQLLGRCARRSSLDEAESWFRQALSVAEDRDLPFWRMRARHELGTIALLRYSGVDNLLEALRLADELGAMATAAILEIELAAGLFGTDDDAATNRAREHAERAVQRATALGMDLVAGYGWMHLAGAAFLAGDAEAGAAAAARARAAVPGNREVDGLVCALEALSAMLADDLDRALERAVRSTDLLRGVESAPPAQTRAALPLLLAVTGEPGASAAIAEAEEAGVGVNVLGRGWLTVARAIVAGREDPSRAADLALQADAELASVPSRLWQHLGRRFAAAAASADGWQVPAGWAGEAERWFRRHGHPGASAACQAIRRRGAHSVPAAWARRGITRREADVLTLIAEGCSNREIADRLVLSPRTVEKHVESLLRRTGTHSRTQLARFAT